MKVEDRHQKAMPSGGSFGTEEKETSPTKKDLPYPYLENKDGEKFPLPVPLLKKIELEMSDATLHQNKWIKVSDVLLALKGLEDELDSFGFSEYDTESVREDKVMENTQLIKIVKKWFGEV